MVVVVCGGGQRKEKNSLQHAISASNVLSDGVVHQARLAAHENRHLASQVHGIVGATVRECQLLNDGVWQAVAARSVAGHCPWIGL